MHNQAWAFLLLCLYGPIIFAVELCNHIQLQSACQRNVHKDNERSGFNILSIIFQIFGCIVGSR
jgi:hypothetical protein